MTENHRHRPIPNEVFDAIVETMTTTLGADWLQPATKSSNFTNAMKSVIHMTEGVHLIADPVMEEQRTSFRVWVDFPVSDLWDADDLAFEVFAQVSEEIFLCTREIARDGVTYRFVSGTMETGNIGVLEFAGPHAKEFADLYRIRSTDGGRYHA